MAVAGIVKVFENRASANRYNQLEGVALNAAADARTVTVTLAKSWRKVKVVVFYTWSAATAVTCDVTESYDGTNYATPQVADYGSTPAPLTGQSYTKAVSASVNFSWMMDVEGVEKLKLVFDGTGAGAGDLVNVQVLGVVGG